MFSRLRPLRRLGQFELGEFWRRLWLFSIAAAGLVQFRSIFTVRGRRSYAADDNSKPQTGLLSGFLVGTQIAPLYAGEQVHQRGAEFSNFKWQWQQFSVGTAMSTVDDV